LIDNKNDDDNLNICIIHFKILYVFATLLLMSHN